MSQKKSGCGCLPLLGITVLAAAGGVYVYLRGLPWQQFTLLDAAKVIPQEAVATSYISTNEQTWSKLSQFGTPEAQAAINNSLQDLKQNLATDSIDYDTDIRPWVGGISIAFLPTPSNEAPEMLIVVGIKDKLKAADFAKKIKKEPGKTILESDYKGITLTEMTTTTNDYLASAVVGNYLVLGTKRQVVEGAIDTYKGSPSYSNKSGVKQSLSQSLDLKNPLAQIYIDDYSQAVEEGIDVPTNAQLPAETVNQLAKVESVVAGVGVEEEGLHFQTITKLDSSVLSQTPQTTPSKILSYFPSNTLAFLNGYSLRNGWNELVHQSENDPSLQSFVKEVRESSRTASLDADTDIFGWMDREFALGIVSTDPSSGIFGIGGMMVWETSARPTAEKTLDKLNQAVQYNTPSVSIETTNIEGKDVTTWTDGQQTVLSYAWLNNNSLAMTVWMPFQTVLDSKSSTPVSQSANFKDTIKSLPQNNLGYFYMDLEQVIKQTQLSSWGMPPDTQAVLDSLKGLAVTATMPDKTTSKVDAILSLKKNQ